jgi:hypothetical protein
MPISLSMMPNDNGTIKIVSGLLLLSYKVGIMLIRMMLVIIYFILLTKRFILSDIGIMPLSIVQTLLEGVNHLLNNFREVLGCFIFVSLY